MYLSILGKVTLVRPLQSRKLLLIIHCTLSGRLSSVRAVQDSKALSLMTTWPLNRMWVSSLQLAQRPVGTVRIVAGNVMEWMPE